MFSAEIKRRPLSYRNKAIGDTNNWAEDSLNRITASYPYPSTLVTSSKTLEEIRELIAQKALSLQCSSIADTAEGAFVGEPGPVPPELEYAVRHAAYQDRPVEDFQVIQHKQGKRYPLQNIVFCPDPGLDTQERDSFISTYKFCTLHAGAPRLGGPFHGSQNAELYPGKPAHNAPIPYWEPNGPLPDVESRILIQWEYPFAAFTNEQGIWTAILHPNAEQSTGRICIGNQDAPEDPDIQRPLFYWDILTNKTCLASPYWTNACRTVMHQLEPVSVTAHFKDREGIPQSTKLSPGYAAKVCHDYWTFNSPYESDQMKFFNHEDSNPALTERSLPDDAFARDPETLREFEKNLKLAPLEIQEHFTNLHNEWKSTITQLSS